MPTILDKIVATKRAEVAESIAAVSAAELRAAIATAPPPRDFFAALAEPGVRLIAEVKRASPSAGVIREDFDPVTIAQAYEAHGAACISVLTDGPYFQGHLDYLRDVRSAVGVPCLRKDFILDTHQLLEARAAGADAVLLIAECLTPAELARLHAEAVELGLAPLVELYDRANLPAVLDAGATLVGVNNRDLRTFEVDLNHTIELRQHVPDQCLLVAESGIKTHADVQRLAAAGVDAMLVGESLMRQPDIGAAVDALLGRGE
ncbi:MAG: indole-3-glycerol phosphate synthase TrpC [Planctomycetota bacterium]